MKKVLIIAGMIAFFCILFFLVPYSFDVFSFSGGQFWSGESWRLLTFSFTHMNLQHLAENLIALLVVSFLAFEFNLSWRAFGICFLLSSIIIALAGSFFFPVLFMAGASMGIYAVLGALSAKGSRLIRTHTLIPLLGLAIFIEYLFKIFRGESLAQPSFHLFGFVTGLGVFYSFFKIKRHRRRVLHAN